MANHEIVILQNEYPNQVVAYEMSLRVIQVLVSTGVSLKGINLNPNNDDSWAETMFSDNLARFKAESIVINACQKRNSEAVIFEFQDTPIEDFHKNNLPVEPTYQKNGSLGITTIYWPAEYIPQTDPDILKWVDPSGNASNWYFMNMSDVAKSTESGLCNPAWVTSVAQEILCRATPTVTV